jgi:hypothetical protein
MILEECEELLSFASHHGLTLIAADIEEGDNNNNYKEGSALLKSIKAKHWSS